ncbi:uncharacterized protein METZ01_LOCUS55971, partial [marine metagenome]
MYIKQLLSNEVLFLSIKKGTEHSPFGSQGESF